MNYACAIKRVNHVRKAFPLLSHCIALSGNLKRLTRNICYCYCGLETVIKSRSCWCSCSFGLGKSVSPTTM